MIKKIKNAGITPIVGLYNYDMPKEIVRSFDGWRSPRLPTQWSGRKAFVAYATTCMKFVLRIYTTKKLTI